MICNDAYSLASVATRRSASIRLVSLERPPLTEFLITALPAKGQSIHALLGEVAEILRDTDAQVISQEVFASVECGGRLLQAMQNTLGQMRWPLTWIDSGGQDFAGTQIWAVSGADVKTLALRGTVTGSLFEDRYATYCRLGGLTSSHVGQERGTQARDVFRQMEGILSLGQLQFTDTVRTWFYLDDILSWYGDFNHARDGFFRQAGVFGGLVPASTGIGAANPSGSALIAGLLAARPKNGSMTTRALPSPLQCPALNYGSSFSRAVELALPDHRRIFVSGTASIAPEGHTIHVGDTRAQIAKSIKVVAAILESRRMQWSDVVRGIAYVRNAADVPLYRRYCTAHGLPPMPAVTMNSVICRDDLLFELEVDAVRKQPGRVGSQPTRRMSCDRGSRGSRTHPTKTIDCD